MIYDNQPKGLIDPLAPQWHGVPLWCVFGFAFHPNIMCCKLSKVGVQQQVNVYGYTEVQQGHGRFNSIDQPLVTWMKAQRMCLFFEKPDDALAFLKRHLTPRGLR